MDLRKSVLAIGLVVACVAFAILQRPPVVPEHEAVRRLFHQMARWSTAASQDENLLVAMLHANYGVGYMSALKEFASEEMIGKIVGVADIRAVFQKVGKIQNDVTLRFLKECPAVMPETDLAKFGSEGL